MIQLDQRDQPGTSDAPWRGTQPCEPCAGVLGWCRGHKGLVQGQTTKLAAGESRVSGTEREREEYYHMWKWN